MSVPALELDDLCFAYPGSAEPVLSHVCARVPEGAFALLVGATGSGKSTLLRLAKPEISPAGQVSGVVRVFGRAVGDLSPAESAEAVGYVSQSPDAQVVCDTVWHEMAFGLENLGTPEPEMRRRVAETCDFFGMEPWFRAQTAELSGGQRQLLALAATLVMRPRLVLLDEPTSMLDPVAEKTFLSLLFRANRELGTTIVVATHAPAPLAAYATCALEVAGGAVRERDLASVARPRPLPAPQPRAPSGEGALDLDDLWFRYQRDSDWVLRGLDLGVGAGEVRAIVGGNGSGKSTLLSLAAGALRPQRGRVLNALRGSQALLPQSPKAALACESVREELSEWAGGAGYGPREVADAMGELGLADAPGRHPLDLSGGQQQMLALKKLLLTRPRLLLLDEPTKGLDDAARLWVLAELARARDAGATIVLATHDVSFAKALADTVTLLFDGQATCTEPTDGFFSSSLIWGA